jgi:hypothetical protein
MGRNAAVCLLLILGGCFPAGGSVGAAPYTPSGPSYSGVSNGGFDWSDTTPPGDYNPFASPSASPTLDPSSW